MTELEAHLQDIALFAHRCLFGELTPVKREILGIVEYKQGTVRGFTTEHYKFLTQNPATHSEWAALALGGHQVSWVLDKQGSYLARVVDGQFTRC